MIESQLEILLVPWIFPELVSREYILPNPFVEPAPSPFFSRDGVEVPWGVVGLARWLPVSNPYQFNLRGPWPMDQVTWLWFLIILMHWHSLLTARLATHTDSRRLCNLPSILCPPFLYSNITHHPFYFVPRVSILASFVSYIWGLFVPHRPCVNTWRCLQNTFIAKKTFV